MKNKKLDFLIRHSKAPKSLYSLVLVALFYASLINLSISIVLEKGIDFALGENQNVNFIFIALTFAVALLFYGIACYIKSSYSEKLKQYISKKLKSDVLEKMFATKYSNIVNFNNGEILNKINIDADACAGFVTDNLFPLLEMLVPITIGLIFVYSKSLVIGVLLTIMLPVLYYISANMAKDIEKYQNQELLALGDQKTFFEEYYNNIKVIKIFGMFGSLNKKNINLFKNVYDNTLAKSKISTRMYAVMDGLIFLIEFSIIVLCVYIYSKGNLNAGEIVAVSNVAIGSVVWPITVVPMFLAGLSSVYASVDRVEEILNLEEENYLEEKITNVDKASIEVENLQFAYDKANTNIFDNFNFELKSNEVVYLMGESGCGKSTLLKILIKLYDIKKGEIYISAEGEKFYDTRKFISYVPQEENVLNISILDNLTLGRDIEFSKIEKVMKQVHLHDHVMSLKDQYDTVLSSEIKFSLGQQKRLSIARSLLLGSKFVLMDEPFSSLDSVNGKEVAGIIRDLSSDCGFLIISHNSELNDYAHRIYNL